MNQKTLEALQVMEKRLLKIDEDLQDPEILKDVKRLTELNKERAGLADKVEEYHKYQDLEKRLTEAKELLRSETDQDMLEITKQEIDEVEHELPKVIATIKELLIPKDPDDDKNVIVEIRGAAGGDEANIFAGDLFRMYSRYADEHNLKIEVRNAIPGEAGGYSQIEFLVKGNGAYSKFKFESGSHRVQRVPKTESKGRIQTSTATVAVLPEVSDVEVTINPADLRIDTYRASGAGGQHVNTTDSAVRITHLPTGIVTSSQDGRSQYQNKDIAMDNLRSKLYQYEKEKQSAAIDSARKSAVGTGARSEKIRTYNYAQNRVTDHRIGLTLNKLDQVMEGQMDELITALSNEEQREKVAEHLNE